MRAAAAQDSKSMVERLYREMLDVMADPDLSIEPEATVSDETVALFNDLMARRGPQTARAGPTCRCTEGIVGYPATSAFEQL